MASSAPHQIVVTFDEEGLALLREIRDLLKAQNDMTVTYPLKQDSPKRLVEGDGEPPTDMWSA